MRFDQMARAFTALALVALISLATAACGGGGGGSDGTSAEAVVMGITIPGVAGGNNFVRADGTSTLVPNVFLNGRLVITLGGAVDPASLPPAGPAIAGPVEILSLTSNTPARGVFSVNPANPNQVIFDAFPPTSVIPGQGCIAGFNGGETYRISVTSAGANGGNVLTVGGDALVTGAAGTFSTIACDPMNPSPAFTDSNGADPQVVAQTPGPGSSNLVGTINGFPTNTQIVIDIDESIDPSSVNASNLILVNKTINAASDVPIGGSVALQQFGSVPGNPSIARITYTTSQPLQDGHDYEFLFLGVTDLAGNPLNAPAVGTRFTITDEMNDTPTAFVEDFSTITNRGPLSESIVWPGNDGSANAGRVAAIFPEAIVGNGLDGIGAFTTNMTINADNQMTVGDPSARPAVYNFTQCDFGDPGNVARTITFTSTTDIAPGLANFPVHFRSQGTLTVRNQTTLVFDGRRQTLEGGTGANATTTSIDGGWGGPGGGRGGTASPVNDPTVVNPQGHPGEGAHTDLMDPTRPGGNIGNTTFDVAQPPTGLIDPFYGGGGGGLAGQNLLPAPNNGPSGGGGGNMTGFAGYGGMPPAGNMSITFTAATNGETQSGSDGNGAGAPTAGVAGQPMAAMMTPLIFAAGGSGGGASGDRGNAAAADPPPTYRAGGAGGGGAGGCRLTSGGDMTFGILSRISMVGGQGGAAMPAFVAHGGGGSGGALLAQTFGTLTPQPSATFDCSGGLEGTPTSMVTEPPLNGEGGRGGDGVVQLEDGNGGFITTGLNFITVRGELFTRVFPSAGTISDVANSIAIDTGSNGTDYTSASATVNVGSNAMSTVVVQVIGVAEDPNGPGQPATTAMSVNGTPLMVGPVPLSQIDQLDGYRFFIIQVSTTYPSPPAVTGADILPFADDVTINYVN